MTLTIGLIGCGNWGKNILRDLLSLDCTVLVADLDKEARLRASARGAAGVSAEAASLPPCDGYVVAIPIPDLAPVCAGLLPREKPIFAEKTLCTSLESADALVRLGGDQHIFAMHKWRYHPGIEALRLLVASDRIGALLELAAVRQGWVDDFHGGDVFWTLAVHDLTIVRHILGEIPWQILHATVLHDQGGLAVGLTASLGDSPVAHISVNGRHARKVSSVTVHGERGMAMLGDACEPFLTVRDGHGEERLPIDTTFPLYLELLEFTEYLRGGPRPRCGLPEAREVTMHLLALRAAARSIHSLAPVDRA